MPIFRGKDRSTDEQQQTENHESSQDEPDTEVAPPKHEGETVGNGKGHIFEERAHWPIDEEQCRDEE